MKTIYYDMDGTLYDLYNLENWLESIEAEKAEIFSHEAKLFTPFFYYQILKLMEKGYNFGVITWTPKDATKAYQKQVAEEKRKWIQTHLPFVSEIHILPYGEPKQNAIKNDLQEAYLIDDNTNVCEKWNNGKERKSINVSKIGVEKALEKIICS